MKAGDWVHLDSPHKPRAKQEREASCPAAQPRTARSPGGAAAAASCLPDATPLNGRRWKSGFGPSGKGQILLGSAEAGSRGRRVAGSQGRARRSGGRRVGRGTGSLPPSHRISRPAQEAEPQGTNRKWRWLRATALTASRRRSDGLAHKKPEENESLSAGFWALLFLFPFPVKGEGSVG